MRRLSISLAGPPRIEVDGVPLRSDTRKATALLSYLAVKSEACSRDALVALLWPRSGRERGFAALRRTLSVLRARLKPDWLRIDRDWVELRSSDEVWIDLHRIASLLAECSAHAHGRQAVCVRCMALLTEAAGLCRGPFLAGFGLKDSPAFDHWQFFVAEEIERQRARVLDRLNLCYCAAGDLGAAVELARRRLSEDPLDESVHAMLMQLYCWSGNRAAALRQFEECRRTLEEEIGSPPQSSTRRLHERLKNGDIPPPRRFAPAPGEAEGADDAAGGPSRPPIESGGRCRATLICVRWSSRSAAERAMERTLACVTRFAGSILEESAGGILVSFHHLTAAQSNPELAVRAALDIRGELRELWPEARIGIATGFLLARPRAQDGAAIIDAAGDLTQRSRLLAEHAGAASIVADELTCRATHEAFQYEEYPAGELAREHSGRVYRIKGIAAFSGESPGMAAGRTPMVGRGFELGRMRSSFERARNGSPQAVLLSGDAGVGKSRLLLELRDSLICEIGDESIRWLEGRCLAPPVSLAYWPFIDLLGQYTAQRASRFSDDRRAADLNIVDLQSKRIIPRRGDGELQPELERSAIFGDLLAFFRMLAKEGTTVVAIDDFQWADELSVDFIDTLLEGLHAERVLFLFAYRPDRTHATRQIESVTRRRLPERTEEIRLHEMSLTESSALLERASPEKALSAELRAWIVERAQGNPFFLEELARAGTAPEESIACDGAGMAVPEAVKLVVQSRYHLLPASRRRVLDQAAVFGRRFRKRLLDCALDSPDLALALDDLEERGFVSLYHTLPEVEYSFKHVLTQQAVYESLAPGKRAELHRIAADAYRAVAQPSSDDFCEELAYHCDRGGMVEAAIEHYLRAGERARRSYANNAAVAFLTRGLDLLRASAAPGTVKELSRELAFLSSLVVALTNLGRIADAEIEGYCRRAKEISVALGDRERMFYASFGLRRIYYARGELADQLQCDLDMLEQSRSIGDPLLQAAAHASLGETMYCYGRFAAQIDDCRECISLMKQNNGSEMFLKIGINPWLPAIGYQAIAQAALGLPESAMKTVQLGLETAQREEEPFGRAFMLLASSGAAFYLRRPKEVATWSSEAARLSKECGFTFYHLLSQLFHGWASGALGETERGIALMNEHLESLGANLPIRALFDAMLAMLNLQVGDLPSAQRALDDGFRVMAASSSHIAEAELLRLRGEIGLRLGDPREFCTRQFEEAARSAQASNSRLEALRALLDLWGIWRQEATTRFDPRERIEFLIRGFDEGFDTVELVEARRVLGKAPA